MSTKGATSTTTKKSIKEPGSFDQLHLDLKSICKTTGWHNNCGLNCLTHFMYSKISTIPFGEFDPFLGNNPEYLSLLETFQQYYHLKETPSWPNILGLLAAHPAAPDREAILAPVLRMHLGKVLIDKADDLWDLDASGAISDYRTTGSVIDIAGPIYHSNKVFFDTHKKEFDQAFIEALRSEPTEVELATAIYQVKDSSKYSDKPDYQPTLNEQLEHVIFQRKTRLEEQFHGQAHFYWMTEGCQRYANYMANMNYSQMVSEGQLQTLSERFNIGVEIYTPSSMRAALLDKDLANDTHGAQLPPQRPYQWTMKVLNTGRGHWTFQEPDSDADKMKTHNQYYEGAPTQYKTENLLQALSKELIIAEVRCLLGEISPEELQELKAVAVLAQQSPWKAVVNSVVHFNRAAYAVFNATPEGKELITLMLANENILKIVNEQFNAEIATIFMQKHGHIIPKLKSLNGATQTAVFSQFLTQHPEEVKRATASPVFDALEEALASQSALTITVASDRARQGIKLHFLAIMQQNVYANEMAKMIEKNPRALAAFNDYSEEAVRTLANSPKLSVLLPALSKRNDTERALFIEKYPTTLPSCQKLALNPTL